MTNRHILTIPLLLLLAGLLVAGVVECVQQRRFRFWRLNCGRKTGTRDRRPEWPWEVR
jgi:hypothetical protein